MVNRRELKLGTRIEMEHTKSKKVAERIAKDHLQEYPHYYTKGLVPMEKRLLLLRLKKKCKNPRRLVKSINCPIRRIKSTAPDFQRQAENFTKI